MTRSENAALSADRLVDDLPAFFQLNRTSLMFGRVDMTKLVAEARATVMQARQRRIDWRIGRLPEAWGDATMLRQALTMLRQVLLNLFSNAVKHTSRCEIDIEGQIDGTHSIYVVRDNGIGFDMRYVGNLFGVFQRLHRVEDFEGTDISITLTKRVINRHSGWIKAEAVPDQGATFTVALPMRPQEGQFA